MVIYSLALASITTQKALIAMMGVSFAATQALTRGTKRNPGEDVGLANQSTSFPGTLAVYNRNTLPEDLQQTRLERLLSKVKIVYWLLKLVKVTADLVTLFDNQPAGLAIFITKFFEWFSQFLL